MPKVTFFPKNKTVVAEAGLTILEVAEEYGIDMEHSCGGCCACSTCAVEVLAGSGELLSTMEEDEREVIDACCEEKTENTRLGCQAKIKGDVKVWIKD